MKSPPVSFYSLKAKLNSGKEYAFDQLQGKYVLLVNTASNCGYTSQYNELEELHRRYPDTLAVLGFPANDFGGQEPGSNEEIAAFCKLSFGVSFPLFEKKHVTGTDAQDVFRWLTRPEQNGWNSQAPAWNFCKYLVSPGGELLHCFSSDTSPLDRQITDHLP